MDSLIKKPARKRLSELLVEAGIIKAEELPKGLEYAQKATEADIQSVGEVKQLIAEQGLSVPTALRALSLSKLKRCTLEQALVELGWRPRKPEGFNDRQVTAERQIKSAFDPQLLDSIGYNKQAGGAPAGPTYTTDFQRQSWSNLKTKGTGDIEVGAKFLKGEPVDIPLVPDMVSEQQPLEMALSAMPELERADVDSFNLSPDQISAATTANEVIAGTGSAEAATDAAVWAQTAAPPAAAIAAWLTPAPEPAAEAPPWIAPAVEPATEILTQAAATAPTAHEQFSKHTRQIEGLPPGFIQAMRLGDLHFSEHKYREAEESYATALKILERTEDADELEIADLLVKMGRASLQVSDYSRAEGYFCRSLKIREISLGRDDISVAECLDYLAEVYDLQSQFLEAEHYYLGALGIKERVLNPDNSEVARSLKKLVAVSKRRGVGRPEEKLSGELLTEAGLLEPGRLEEGLRTAQEKEIPIGRALISLNYLTDEDLQAVLQAQLLLREGVIPAYLAVRALRLASLQQLTFEAALREIGIEPDDDNNRAVFDLLKAAQELLNAERQLSADDPGLALLCLKVGDVYTDHHQYVQAEALYRRALGISEKQPGIVQREVSEILGRIGDLQFRQQRYDQAKEIYLKLLDLWELEVGTADINFVNCLESLAACHYVQGDYKESGRLYQVAIGAKEKLLGPEHPAVASAIQGRANCYFGVKRFGDAEGLYRRAISMYERVYGPNNEQVAILFNVLGDVFYTQGHFSKAQIEYAKGLDAFSKCTNPDVWAFTGMLEKIAHCFAECGNYQSADAYYRHFIKTREGFGTFHAPDMPDALERYAAVLDKLNRTEEADAVRQHAQSTRLMCAGQRS